MTFRAKCILGALTLGLVASACAQDAQLERELRQRYLGKELFLRGFYTDSNLTYDSTGKLTADGGQDCWMLAQFEVKKIALHGPQLVMEGERLGGTYDHHDRFLIQRLSDRVHVEVNLGAHQSAEDIHELLDKIFLNDNDVLDELIPRIPPRPAQGASITPPREQFAPDVPYTKAAKKMHRTGVALVRLTVGEDGLVHATQLLRCVGAGLDDEAMKTLSTWRFTPAKEDGRPVEAEVDIEVQF